MWDALRIHAGLPQDPASDAKATGQRQEAILHYSASSFLLSLVDNSRDRF